MAGTHAAIATVTNSSGDGVSAKGTDRNATSGGYAYSGYGELPSSSFSAAGRNVCRKSMARMSIRAESRILSSGTS